MSLTEQMGGMTTSKDATLHQRILSDIEGQIVSGAWPPGHRIPFEMDLAAQYDCSRMTVNKVLSALADAGLVVRRRRAGSFVSRPRVQSAILQIPDLKAEIEKRGERYGYRLLDLRKRTASAQDRVRLGIGGRAGHVGALAMNGDKGFRQRCSFGIEHLAGERASVAQTDIQDGWRFRRAGQNRCPVGVGGQNPRR